jgi:integration host factor subunit alpha
LRFSEAERCYRNVGLSRNESASLVDSVFTEISKSLINGQDVKISSFGTFIVRNKKERVGRNPKTGEEVPITARQVVTFRASNVLKSEVSDLSKVDTSIETENR